MVRRISAFTLLLALCVTAAVSPTVLAEPSLEDAKDYRQSVMAALGAHIGAISMHVRGLAPENGFLPAHAESLAKTASELSHLFPPGSNVDDSEALPAIWEDAQAFTEAVEKAEQATAAFSEAAASGDADTIDSAFREVASACRGCHDRFRKEHEH